MACKFCTIQIVLLVIAFLIIIGISGAFFYFGWYLKEIILILFGANKTPVEVIEEGAFGGTYFRDIYSDINGKWYRKL